MTKRTYFSIYYRFSKKNNKNYFFKQSLILENLYCFFIFSDDSLYFLMNNRLCLLYKKGTSYYAKYRYDEGKFARGFQKAKATIPADANTISILSDPRASQTIQSGNWDLSLGETDTMLVTNRENGEKKLTLKGQFPGFMFEHTSYKEEILFGMKIGN